MGEAGGAPPALDLARCSVFVDFDGTISSADVGLEVLERFVPGRWAAVDARYESGEIGSREYVTALWSLLAGTDPAALRAVAAEVPLDPGFGPLVAALRAGGAEVTVVSDGLGFYVADRCAAERVPVLANGVDDGRPSFPNADPSCPCGLCGTCKATPVRRARARGRATVVVGDGTSDRFGAAEADLVFAKDRLVDWCREAGIDHVAFRVLDDVRRTLEAMAGTGSPPDP